MKKITRRSLLLGLGIWVGFFILPLWFGVLVGGCGRAVEAPPTTIPPSPTTTTTIPPSPTTTTIPPSPTTTLPPALTIVSRSPTLDATGISFEADLVVTFSNPVHQDVRDNMVKDLLNYITLEVGHTAGQIIPSQSATLEWSNDYKTFTVLGVVGWSELTPGAGVKTVEVCSQPNKIKDIYNQYLAGGTPLWRYILKEIPPLPTYSISGKVLFSSTNDPVRNVASVVLRGPTQTVVTTPDAQTGFYSFNGLTSGLYTLEAKKEGWDVSTQEVTIVNSNVTKNFRLAPTHWEVLTVEATSLPLTDIASEEGLMFAVGGGSSIILKSADGGSTWTIFGTPTNEALIWVEVDKENDGLSVLVADRLGGVWITTQEETGDEWVFYGDLTSEVIVDFFPLSESTFECITETGKLIRSFNSGETWSDITPSGMTAKGIDVLWDEGESGKKVYVVGDNGNVKYTDDSFAESVSWQAVSSLEGVAGNVTLEAISVKGDYAIATSADGSIFTSTNAKNGSSSNWQKELDGIPYSLKGCESRYSGLSGSLVVGEKGLIMRRK